MNAPEKPAASDRFLFVDLLRGWAVLVMIETHVLNALLAQSLKDQAPFKILTFVNGLVAPSFLFCAGFGLAISLRRRWDKFMRFERPFWRTVVRMVFILVVAYSLHLPFFSLRRMAGITDEHLWISFFQVDILQVIAVTLLLLVLLASVTRKPDIFRTIVSILALAVIFAAPVVRAMDLSGLPIWFRPYLSLQFQSQFPMFPWAAFLMVGLILGFWYVRAAEEKKDAECMKWFGILAVGGMVLSVAAEFAPFGVYPNHDFFRASPEFFFVRVGCVVMALAGLWLLGRKRQSSGPSLLSLFGQESLLVYVVHLLIVYGHDYDFSFVRMFGQTLGYVQALGLFAGLTIVMYLLAFVWHSIKKWNMRVAYGIEVCILGGIVAEFVLK
ncbi:MAG TPA: heparan-alpha-glucosaminide N-acetyltransferase domain-containing protein [Bacteroidota bacterium]